MKRMMFLTRELSKEGGRSNGKLVGVGSGVNVGSIVALGLGVAAGALLHAATMVTNRIESERSRYATLMLGTPFNRLHIRF